MTSTKHLGTGNLFWSEENGIRTSYEYDVFGRISKEIQPYDTSFYPTKSYNYSFDGTAPESIKVSQRTTANKTLDTYYYYDGFGNLVQLKTPSYDNKQVVKNFFYDGSGRVRAVQSPYFDSFSATIAGVSATASYTNYSYDAMARVTNVTNPDATTATVVFDRWLISTYDENGHRKDYQLDAYDRIVKVQEFNIDPVLDDGVVHGFNTTYAYDAADQLIQINDTYGNQFRFAYDSLGRRTRLNDPDIGEWNYTYDLVGNLVSQAGGGGNLIAGDGFYREYNSLNQLIRIRNGSSATSPLLEQYYYDPFGDRIKIWRNDSAGTVVYTPFREFMQVRNSTGVYNFTYVYDGSTLVARVEPDNSVHYYHADHLGSTTLITDQSGNVVEETFYEPFGAVTSGGTADVKLYTGQFSDELTNQYYYGARYYIPSIGKYGQADPIIQNVYDPQFLNHYAYARNNPFIYVDETGMFNTRIFGLGISQFGVGGLLALYGGPPGILLGIKELAYGATSLVTGSIIDEDDTARVEQIKAAQSGGNDLLMDQLIGSLTLEMLTAIEDSVESAFGCPNSLTVNKCFSSINGKNANDDTNGLTEKANQINHDNKQNPDVVNRRDSNHKSWDNVVQRADGHWVREGSSDDDGTRKNSDKTPNKEKGGKRK